MGIAITCIVLILWLCGFLGFHRPRFHQKLARDTAPPPPPAPGVPIEQYILGWLENRKADADRWKQDPEYNHDYHEGLSVAYQNVKDLIADLKGPDKEQFAWTLEKPETEQKTPKA